MPTASSLSLKDFSPKSQDAVALQQIKERGALPMTDRGDIRQAIDRCSNIWASPPGGAGYGQFEHTDNDGKIQRSGRNGQERLMYEQSHSRLSPLWLSASSSACHGLLIITVSNGHYLQSPARQKCQRTGWRTRQLLTCRCVSVMLLRSMQKYTKLLADAKAGNDALRDDAAAGRRRLHIKAVCQSVREATTASGVDNAASPTGRHR